MESSTISITYKTDTRDRPLAAIRVHRAAGDARRGWLTATAHHPGRTWPRRHPRPTSERATAAPRGARTGRCTSGGARTVFPDRGPTYPSARSVRKTPGARTRRPPLQSAVRLVLDHRGDRLTRDDHLYDFIVEIDHNTAPRIAGRGSAVFLHLARDNFSPTAGCVAMTKSVMLRLLPNGPGDENRDRLTGNQRNARHHPDRDRIKDPARSLARRHQVLRARQTPAAARPRRGLCDPGENRKVFGGKSVRLEDRGDHRGRTKAHQRRRPDGRPDSPRDRHTGWRIGVMAGNEMRVAEPKFAFRMRVDLPVRPTPYTMQQVLDAVDTLHPGRGISDSRFADFVSAGAAQIIADNACAHLFVLGSPTSADWRSLDLVEERPVVSLRGQQFIGHGKNVLGDPRVALTWLANELRQLGVTLKAGRNRYHGHLPSAASDSIGSFFAPSISVRWEKCLWNSCEPSPRHCLRQTRSACARERSDEAIHSFCGEMDCFASLAMTGSAAPENRRAHAHMGGAELDRNRKIGAHAHRQVFHPFARGNLYRR